MDRDRKRTLTHLAVLMVALCGLLAIPVTASAAGLPGMTLTPADMGPGAASGQLTVLLAVALATAAALRARR